MIKFKSKRKKKSTCSQVQRWKIKYRKLDISRVVNSRFHMRKIQFTYLCTARRQWHHIKDFEYLIGKGLVGKCNGFLVSTKTFLYMYTKQEAREYLFVETPIIGIIIVTIFKLRFHFYFLLFYDSTSFYRHFWRSSH